MPGSRSRDERDATVMLRVRSADKEAWTKWVKERGGYLSELIRLAVAEHMDRNRTNKRIRYWGGEWGR